jgi:FKBP-type peptidyl-prolyl cis-trans isomerase
LRTAVLAALLLLATPAASRAEDAKPAAASAPAEGKKPASPAAKKAPADPKALRAVGLSIAQQLKVFELSSVELDHVLKGIRDGATGKASFDPSMQQGIQDLVRVRMQATAEKAGAEARRAGPPYLEKAAKEPGAQKTASGLVFLSLKEGTGASPAATDKVKVHYKGTLTDGKEFDSSYSRGQPAEFPLNGVIPCWTEALQKMKVGGKAKIVCPHTIAYGEQGRPPVIPPSAVLTFEVELIDVVK